MTRPYRLADERGAVIIHVAISLLALIAFSTIVVDYGLMWVSRRQAQNAADAGALAGAISLAFDSVGTNATRVRDSARIFATKHVVWGQGVPATAIDIRTSLDAPPFLCPDGTPTCVQVDVFRGMPDRLGANRGTALPVFFAPLVGVTSQGVRATATAQGGAGNATDCLKPWAVADKWVEVRPTAKTWDPLDTFDKWITKGQNAGTLYPLPRDYYVPTTKTDVGSGFTPGTDLGLQLVLKLGAGSNESVWSSGWFKALDLPCAKGGGGDCYRENIMGCNGVTFKIGDKLTVSTEQGVKAGPTEQGANGTPQGGDGLGLIEQDPTAKWVKDPVDAPYVPGQPQPGSVMYSKYPVSPRIVPVALISLDDFLATDPNGKSEVTIVNIMGFFIEGTCNDPKNVFPLEPHAFQDCKKNNGAVVGRLVGEIGLKIGTDDINANAAFLKVIRLVR